MESYLSRSDLVHLLSGSGVQFSRKRANLALFLTYHNFVKIHRSIRMTPAMKAGLARRPWSMAGHRHTPHLPHRCATMWHIGKG